MAVRYPSFDDLKREKVRQSRIFNSLKSKLINGPGAGPQPGPMQNTPTPSFSLTPTITPSVSLTPSITPSISITPTNTITPTITNSVTPSVSITPTLTPSITETPTNTPTISITPSITPTISETPTITPTISITPSVTPTISETPTITPTISITPSFTPTNTCTVTYTKTPTITPTNTQTPSITPSPSLTPNLIPSPTPTPYTFYVDGPGFSNLQGVSYNALGTSRFYFSGTGQNPVLPGSDLIIYYNGTPVAIVSFAAEFGNNRTGQAFKWVVDFNNPNSPVFYGVFLNGNVYFNDPFQLSPTPTPTIQNSSTPTPTPTPTPTTSTSQQNVLFDKSSFSVVAEPYRTYLEGAADRWSNFLRIPASKLNGILTSDPTFAGISINNISFYNNPSDNTIASCGVVGFYAFAGTHQLITSTFNLNINQRWEGTYDANDWINVLTHELGHALGIGQFWQSFFTIYGSETPTSYFLNGSSYNIMSTAYNSLIGSSRPRVPLESSGGSGTASGHWENNYRSSAAVGSLGYNYPGLQNELMVGFYSQSLTFKLSQMSIKGLVDFGYEEINPGSSEGAPTLVNSLQSNLVNQSKIDFHKYENCVFEELPTAEIIFDESLKPIAYGAVVDIKP